ncbi:MAG: alkaline phosphatase D family protein [Saprospiraceae bacterium]
MKIKNKNEISRRDFVKHTATLALGAEALIPGIPLTNMHLLQDDLIKKQSVYQAMGTRVGEVTDTTAIVWTRITLNATRNNEGLVIPGRAQNYRGKELPKVTVPLETLEGACPGHAGYIRLQYSPNENLKGGKHTKWIEVSAGNDFIHQFHLTGLSAATTYHYISESCLVINKKPITSFRGRFQTAPHASTSSDLLFCLMTCQGYPDRGHPDGHHIYPAMLALNPQFACLTGDLVYYDNDMPRALNESIARYHWERMFSLPRLIDFNRNVGTYWLKDDHDTLDDDSEPGATMGDFTFSQGQQIFRQQAPINTGPEYRTFRWGADLQIWLSEGRDHRSDSDLPDGPDKTIWGSAQKAWFKKTVKESTATWKILISPTPFVGPDRKQKNDNHSNAGFKHEGDELRQWMQENVPDNFFVICGDRHWQYHSVHPVTDLHEFSIGAASDEHAGGTPGEDKNYHRFHLVKGGFISVKLTRSADLSKISVRHHDIHGAIVYEWSKERKVTAS